MSLETIVLRLVDELADQRKSMDAERAAWAAERRELYTRIQAYQVGEDPKAPATAASQVAEVQEEPQERFTSAQLEAMGLVYNPDGGVVDKRTGDLYESVAAWRATQEWLRSKGLPLDTPREEFEEAMTKGD